VNLFASIDTHQRGLHLEDAVDGARGENEAWLRRSLEGSPRVVVGWGSGNGAVPHQQERRRAISARSEEIRPILSGHELWCVGQNRGGSPRHPGRGIRNDVGLLRYVPMLGRP